MNYLAHFHLSHGDEGLMIGALMGDVVKGPLKGQFPNRWEQGIQLHRMIDAHTDQHPLIKQCSLHFSSPLKRYTGIMLDVAFDHFLNKHWQQLHHEPLNQFTQTLYPLIERTDWPEAAQQRAQRIVEYDLLNRYEDWEFVLEVISSIGQRIRRPNPLAQANEALSPHYKVIEQTFLAFYPQLQQFAQTQRQQF